MKKLLALVLAMVMTLGLATVSSSAAYSDEADVSLNEAVDVMSAVGVFQGADGKFSPKANLTREQAAKLIAYLDLGESTAEALPALKVFDDVAADRWSAKYIAYCADAGYIAGDGTGKFSPAGELTGYAFGKMVLCVLGYDADIEGFTGNNWSIGVAKLMEKNDIADGVDGAASATLTREQAAQYCLNALKATMVEYDTKGTSIEINGAKIATGASSAKAVKVAVTAAGNYANAISNDYTGAADYTVELGEKLYKGDLTYGAGAAADDFGRVQTAWQYKLEDVAAHVSTAFKTYTARTTAATIAKDLKGYKANGTTIVDKDTPIGATVTAIGESGTFGTANTTPIATTLAALTDYGKLVEIYVSSSTKEITNVVVVSYTVAKITDVTTNAKGDVTYTINATQDIVYADKDAGTDGVKFVGFTPAKNDIVTYTDESGLRYVYPTTSVTGKMTKYNFTDDTMVVGGTTYYATAIAANAGTSGLTTAVNTFTGTGESEFYLDQYGYVVGVKGVNDTKYAVIDSISLVNATGVEGSAYAEARLVFEDGSTKVVKVKSIDGFSKLWAAGTSLAAYDDTSGTGGTALAATPAVGTYTGYLSSGNSTTAVKFLVLSTSADDNNTLFKNKVYTYTISSEKYVLTTDASVTGGTAAFTKGVPAITTLTGTTNNETKFVVKTLDGSDDVWTAYTGYKNMPTVTGTAVADYATSSGKIVFVYFDATGATNVGDTTSNVAFFFADEWTVDNTDSDKPLYEYAGIVDGELKTVVATALLSPTANTLYKATLNDDGQVTAISAATGAKFYAVTADGATPAADGILNIDNGSGSAASVNSALTTKTLTYDGSETVYFVHYDSKTISTGSIESVKDNEVIYVNTADAVTTAKGYAISVAYVLVND